MAVKTETASSWFQGSFFSGVKAAWDRVDAFVAGKILLDSGGPTAELAILAKKLATDAVAADQAIIRELQAAADAAELSPRRPFMSHVCLPAACGHEELPVESLQTLATLEFGATTLPGSPARSDCVSQESEADDCSRSWHYRHALWLLEDQLPSVPQMTTAEKDAMKMVQFRLERARLGLGTEVGSERAAGGDWRSAIPLSLILFDKESMPLSEPPIAKGNSEKLEDLIRVLYRTCGTDDTKLDKHVVLSVVSDAGMFANPDVCRDVKEHCQKILDEQVSFPWFHACVTRLLERLEASTQEREALVLRLIKRQVQPLGPAADQKEATNVSNTAEKPAETPAVAGASRSNVISLGSALLNKSKTQGALAFQKPAETTAVFATAVASPRSAGSKKSSQSSGSVSEPTPSHFVAREFTVTGEELMPGDTVTVEYDGVEYSATLGERDDEGSWTVYYTLDGSFEDCVDSSRIMSKQASVSLRLSQREDLFHPALSGIGLSAAEESSTEESHSSDCTPDGPPSLLSLKAPAKPMMPLLPGNPMLGDFARIPSPRLSSPSSQEPSARGNSSTASTSESSSPPDALSARMFEELDQDEDGLLNEAELCGYGERVGFTGTAVEWSHFYKGICMGFDVNPERGLDYKQFLRLASKVRDQPRLFC